MTVRVEVEPAVIRWARSRPSLDAEALAKKFPKLDAWEAGDVKPTLKQLDAFAIATRTPVGELLLPNPPAPEVPIPDFRTIGDAQLREPSPDLLDTIYACERRQDWYHAWARQNRIEPVSLVGHLTTDAPAADAVSYLGEILDFEPGGRGRTFDDALSELRDQLEQRGVLVMMSGVVGANTNRVLDPDEFRGFALVDDLAPVVFVNSADTKAARVFTLVHEVAHLLVSQSALSNPEPATPAANDVERWCNSVAASFLVPAADLDAHFDRRADLASEVRRLVHRYKASGLTLLRRLLDTGLISRDVFGPAWAQELAEALAGARGGDSGGGDFYNSQPVRVSKRFARAVIESTLEGTTSYTDAFSMIGFRKVDVFDEMARRLGVV